MFSPFWQSYGYIWPIPLASYTVSSAGQLVAVSAAIVRDPVSARGRKSGSERYESSTPNPEIVMAAGGASATLEAMVMVMVLSWPGSGLLCRIERSRNSGAYTLSGTASPAETVSYTHLTLPTICSV
eukprot:1956158-Rhodomonas_salina.1